MTYYPLSYTGTKNGACLQPGRAVTGDDPAGRGMWLEEVKQHGQRVYDLHTKLAWIDHGGMNYEVECPHCGRMMETIGRKDSGPVIGRYVCRNCSGRQMMRAHRRYMG